MKEPYRKGVRIYTAGDYQAFRETRRASLRKEIDRLIGKALVPGDSDREKVKVFLASLHDAVLSLSKPRSIAPPAMSSRDACGSGKGAGTEGALGAAPCDESVLSAVAALDRENPAGIISGRQLEELIHNALEEYALKGDDSLSDAVQVLMGPGDWDGTGAGREYEDLNAFIMKNAGRLSPDAAAKWAVYEKTVKEIRREGQGAIPIEKYREMLEKMKSASGYADRGAGAAIEALLAECPRGPVSGEQMERFIIKGTSEGGEGFQSLLSLVTSPKDRDGTAAGVEYDALRALMESLGERLTDAAKAKWEVYERSVKEAQQAGKSGLDDATYSKMLKDIRNIREK
ncbi:MAG: hypothetical protein RDV48_28170 [Candidatus Eremiobacteraeota bacterium]|nr:hypothetical protein [Candidatus Eremiobacteraeota bacterium]